MQDLECLGRQEPEPEEERHRGRLAKVLGQAAGGFQISLLEHVGGVHAPLEPPVHASATIRRSRSRCWASTAIHAAGSCRGAVSGERSFSESSSGRTRSKVPIPVRLRAGCTSGQAGSHFPGTDPVWFGRGKALTRLFDNCMKTEKESHSFEVSSRLKSRWSAVEADVSCNAIPWLARLAIRVWVAWLGLVMLLFAMLRLAAWHPHFLPVMAMLALLTGAGLMLLIGGTWRLSRGPGRKHALVCLLLGLPPLGFLGGHLMYGFGRLTAASSR